MISIATHVADARSCTLYPAGTTHRLAFGFALGRHRGWRLDAQQVAAGQRGQQQHGDEEGGQSHDERRGSAVVIGRVGRQLEAAGRGQRLSAVPAGTPAETVTVR